MKKIMIVIYAGICCFGTVDAFAQDKKEMPKPESIQASIQTSMLQRQINELTIQVANLETEIANLKKENNKLKQQITPKPATTGFPSYYANKKVRQICQDIGRTCTEWAVEMAGKDSNFQILSFAKQYKNMGPMPGFYDGVQYNCSYTSRGEKFTLYFKHAYDGWYRSTKPL